ncbi:MAG: pyridoxal-phosphate dependent enzyme [Chloroflexota bacterium]|nr:pyridoxal-phosphate dependent enzyme [Chloroflexota bacterium]
MSQVLLPPRRCARCEAPAPDALAWRCACGGPLEYEWTAHFDPSLIQGNLWSQWRYGAMLLPPGVPLRTHTSLGEGMTPLTSLMWEGRLVTFKLEFLMPTGSYKDRGSATLLSVLRAEGHRALVEDSSGNAGASIAAYAAAAGIDATIFVPAHASPGKKAQIAAFGATLREIEGPRQATSEACHRAAQTTLYASHAWHPAFLMGQVAAAWEVWEQMEGKLPDAIVVPLGQGGMLLGYYRGFLALHEAGLIDRMPRLVGVQSTACAPVVHAWARGEGRVEPVEERETIAEGIRIKAPARGDEILRALRESDGFVLAVEDDAIQTARRALAQRGLFVETTSAVPVAALSRVGAELGERAAVLVPLSGSGLKEGR